MQSLAELVKAFASLAWPALAIFVIYKFFPLIKGFLSRDKVTIKIGEMEISAEQATQSAVSQIEDLQNKVVAIEEKIAQKQSGAAAENETLMLPIRRGDKFRILWVDDFPSNNAIQIKKLMSDGYWIDMASSTAQAIQMFEFTKYDLVLSDMGRIEENINQPNAGILLAREIRKRDKQVPIIIFSTSAAIARFEGAALESGVNLLTNSTVDLYRVIASEFEKKKSAN